MPRWDKDHCFTAVSLPAEATAYLTSLEKGLARATQEQHQRALQRFYLWLDISGRTTSELSPRMLESGYILWCARSQKLARGYCDQERYRMRTYMIWLIRSGHLPHRKATDFYPQSLKSIPLPECALQFIEQRKEVSKYAPRRYGQLFNLFHQWLSERGIELTHLKHAQVRSFLNFLDKRGYQPKPLHVRKLHMRIYLDWLRDRNLIACDLSDLFSGTTEQYRNFKLPGFADEYLSELRTHLSPETVLSYQTGIRGFHRFLQRERIPFSKLRRPHCVGWMEWMFEKEYSASTRLQRIVTVKGYLAWVVDRKIYRFHVDHLLRSDDLPQLDDLLPRPLPPSVDQEVQRRLCASRDIYHKGALLLRYTGLRLGDLERLAFDPIQKDEKGRSFLLVPPGKIKVERLIPIEDRTIVLIREIQKEMAVLRSKWALDPADDRLFAGRKKKSCFHQIYRRFKKLTQDLEVPGVGAIYPHRLRHSYATSLLNAGIHPAVLMVLLGHTDLRMTFRYAKISTDLVHRAYFTAYDQIQKGIQFPTPKIGSEVRSEAADPVALLQVAAKWLTSKRLATTGKKTKSILRRLQKITREIQTFHSQDP